MDRLWAGGRCRQRRRWHHEAGKTPFKVSSRFRDAAVLFIAQAGDRAPTSRSTPRSGESRQHQDQIDVGHLMLDRILSVSQTAVGIRAWEAAPTTSTGVRVVHRRASGVQSHEARAIADKVTGLVNSVLSGSTLRYR